MITPEKGGCTAANIELSLKALRALWLFGMYQRFSKRVDAVVKQARAIAREGDQEYVGTEHVLLAILQEGTGVGAKLLRTSGIDEYGLKGKIDKLVKKNLEETWVFGNLPGSPHLKSTVACAVNLAGQFQAQEVCTEHLVLAMLKEKDSVAELALRSFGMSYDSAREKVGELIPQPPDGDGKQ